MTALSTLLRAPRCRRLNVERLVSGSRAKRAGFAPKMAVPAHDKMAHTLAHTISSSPAETFLGGLSATHRAAICIEKPDASGQVKAEIAKLLREKSYTALLAAISRWTAPTSKVPWQNVLHQRELAHILRVLIDYQKDILYKAGTQKMMGHSGESAQNMQMAHVREMREMIRAVYANLLSVPGQESGHLYAKASGFLDEPRPGAQRLFSMSAADYENVLSLELNNGKLDLASRWFRRMERQYGAAFYAHMTHTLWVLRFKIYGHGQSSLWRVEKSALNDVVVNPRQSAFKAGKKWLDLLGEYTAHQKEMGRERAVFCNELIAVMLLSVAHGHNVDQATRLVEVNWGLSPKGEVVPGYTKPAAADPLFPDLDVLTAVVVAMLFNQKYVASMAYINAFQQQFGIDLSKPRSRQFWDQIFRWAEISTKYSDARAFQHYISETNSRAFAGSEITLSDDFSVLLGEAKKSADFDYEGYLKFMAALRGQRVGLLSELWKCFHQSEPGFSARPYRTFLLLAEEYSRSSANVAVSVTSTDVENEHLCSSVCYEILQQLAKEHQKHLVSPDSFNARAAAGTSAKIRGLYVKTMKVLIHAKGLNGLIGEIPHIVAKWSLDSEMSESMVSWVRRREEQYLERKNQLEAAKLAEEDEDGFLDLL